MSQEPTRTEGVSPARAGESARQLLLRQLAATAPLKPFGWAPFAEAHGKQEE